MASAVRREHVIACYRAFCDREPESENVILDKISRNASFEKLIFEFINSSEFAAKMKTGILYDEGVAKVFHTNNSGKVEFRVTEDDLERILKT
jgi:hypothetical protein